MLGWKGYLPGRFRSWRYTVTDSTKTPDGVAVSTPTASSAVWQSVIVPLPNLSPAGHLLWPIRSGDSSGVYCLTDYRARESASRGPEDCPAPSDPAAA